LTRDKTYQVLGHKNPISGYKNYIAQGVGEDLKRYYGHFNILQVLGSAEFKEGAIENCEETDLETVRQVKNN